MVFAKKIVATVLAGSIIFFTLLAILAIWGVFVEDVARKSLSTLGVMLVASLLTLVALKIVENKEHKKEISN